MRFSLLRVVLWIGLYLVIIEVGLEIRAHYRGYDTLLLGSYQQVGRESAEARSNPGVEDIGGSSSTGKEARNSTAVRYWIASSSHAEDVYLSPSVTFPSVLERLFRSSGMQVRVINASHAGMDIIDNTNDIRSRGLEVRPDYVILYQMSSTIMSLSKRLLSKVSSTRPGQAETVNKSVARTSRRATAWSDWLIEQTAIYAQLKGHITSRLTGKRLLTDSLGTAGDAEFEASIREFVAATREIGATPVLCTFATSHVKEDLQNLPDSVVTFVFKYNMYLSLPGWFDTINRFNNILRNIAAEEGVLLIDIERHIAGHQEYFRDFVHFTPSGHSAVAEVIYRGLSTRPTDIQQRVVKS